MVFVATVLLGLMAFGQPVLAHPVAPEIGCCSVAPRVTGTVWDDVVETGARYPGTKVPSFNHNPGAGFPNQPTNVFFIKGSSSPSVVPYNPTWGS